MAPRPIPTASQRSSCGLCRRGLLHSFDDEQGDRQQGEAVGHPDSGDRREYVPCHGMSEVFGILSSKG
jgi:hypothetical protein